MIEDRYDALQRFMTAGAAMGSIAMAVQISLAAAGASGFPILVAALTSLGGWTVFGITVLRTRRLNSTEEGRAYLAQAVRDERLSAIRNRSFTNAFAAVIVLQALFLGVGAFLGETVLTVSVTASATIAVGVTTALISYHRLQDAE